MSLELRLESGSARARFADAIIQAFRTEPALARALLRIDQQLNLIATGALTEVVFSVVEEYHARSQLRLLLAALRVANGGSQHLIAFEAKHSRRFFDAGPEGTPAEVQRLDVLLDVLDVLDATAPHVTAEIAAAYIAVVGEPLPPWCPKLMDRPHRRALVGLLAERDPLAGASAPLVTFVDRLRSGAPASERAPLTAWLDGLGALGVVRGARDADRAPPSADAHCFVMVRIVPNHMGNGFRGTAWACRGGANPLVWEDEAPTIAQLSVAFVSQFEVAGSLLDKSLAGLRDDQISFEFIVPHSLLDERVEAWTIPGLEVRIGKIHAVAVRSHERIYGGRHHRRWSARWEALFGGAGSPPRMRPFDPENDVADEPFRVGLLSDLSVLGFVLVAPAAARRPELFQLWMAAGIPVLIWPRCDKPDRRARLTRLATCIESEDADARRAVFELRRSEVAADGLGEDIVLLWDDPRRRPPDHDAEYDLTDPNPTS